MAVAVAPAGCVAGRTGGSGGPGGPAAAVPETTPGPTEADPRALYEGFTREHPWRARVTRLGTWKLAPEEDWRPAPERDRPVSPFDVVVADRAGAEVRVVAQFEDLLVAVWVPSEDLAVVPVEQVDVVREPGAAAAADGPGASLAGGAEIEVLEEREGWTHVRPAATEFRVDGWVPSVLVGRVYRDADFDVLAETLDLEPAAGLEVYDGSGLEARVLAVLRPDAAAAVRVRALGEPREGRREVLFASARALLRGWVRADALAPADAQHPAPSSHSVFSFHVRGEHNWLQVPVGTELRTAEGDVFAVTTQGTKLVVASDRAPRRTAVSLRTPWGDVVGWTACEPVPDGMPAPLVDTCVPPFEE
jgi:hypothetical protein